MTETIWKYVVGYEYLYQVSNRGQVRSTPRLKLGKVRKDEVRTYYLTKTKILSPKVDKDGYLAVTLTDSEGSRRFFRVHRLVATAFIENPCNSEIVHHKDECVTNNCVDNLAWVTPRENLFASDVFGRLSKKFSTPIICKTKMGELVGEYESVICAGKSLGIDPRHISSVLNGRRKHTRGYVFERRMKDGN